MEVSIHDHSLVLAKSMPKNLTSLATIVLFAASVSQSLAQPFAVQPEVVRKIWDALPESPMAKPKQERKVLIFSKTAGFRHGSIPVGAKSIMMLGDKTGAFAAIAKTTRCSNRNRSTSLTRSSW
jgi:hypothetical protein